MKRLFFITLALLLVSAKIDSVTHFTDHLLEPKAKTETVQAPTLEEELAPLLEAMIQVESRGKNITGDNGNAVGILQIWKIQVDECNRVAKRMGMDVSFSYKDRWDEEKSKEMFFVNVRYWNKDSGYDWEEIARVWNGGPNGMNQPATAYYWDKVQFELEAQQLALK